MASFLVELLDAVYPPLCPLCGERICEGAGCPDHALPRGPTGPRCGRCASLLPEAIPDGSTCAACRRKAPGYRRLVTLADYRRQTVLREWILPFKHAGRRDLAAPLGWALARRFREATDSSDRSPGPRLLVPVPLHPLRRLERGYDQARLLAEETASHAGVPWRPVLVRRRWTPPQGTPGARSRAANVEEAFAVGRRGARDVRGVEVWLVDDVVSSGATVAACARALRRAGARVVNALCLARP